MKLSIIIVFHNMAREAPRTLHSLSRAGQIGVTDLDYEIIAIDNGSSYPVPAVHFENAGDDVTYINHITDSVSPVGAVNLGARMAKGEFMAVIVDGARMASPGLINASMLATRLATDPFVFALAWHLGPKIQNISMLEGYDQAAEDALLETIAWPVDGYRLFEISTIAPSSAGGFFSGLPPECSWLCMRRATFLEMGGFAEEFVSPGGGLVNHDFRNRVLAKPGLTPIGLLGEGVFHQFHGGVATNVPMAAHPLESFEAEYQRVRGRPYAPIPSPDILHLGRMHPAARRFVTRMET